MINVNGISYRYNSSENIIQDIGFSLETGKFLAILGNNGVGKSTLLKCLNKILKANSGEFLLDGENVLQMSHNEIAKRIAFVSQNVANNRMSVRDIVMLGRRPYMQWSFTEQDYAIVDDAIKRMNIESISHRFLDQLSGGERQKVMLARALAQRPKLLLLDEPTSSLDIYNQYKVLNIIQELCHKDGITAIVVIHNIDLALRFCDRFLLLKNGEPYAEGDAGVIDRAALKNVYNIDGRVVDVEGRKMILVEE